ncbi:putative transporter small subunit [Psychrobacter sp. NPDC078409]
MDNVFIYGLYILIWPAITLGVLVLICTATYRDVRSAKRDNRDIV